jgi:hypothetical protein
MKLDRFVTSNRYARFCSYVKNLVSPFDLDRCVKGRAIRVRQTLDDLKAKVPFRIMNIPTFSNCSSTLELVEPWWHKMAVFCVLAQCSVVEVLRRFGSACCLHHQGCCLEDIHLRIGRRENLKARLFAQLEAQHLYVLWCTIFSFHCYHSFWLFFV